MILKDAEILAKQLMEQHGLIDTGWRFEFDKAKKRFGACNFSSKTISLSAPIVELNDESHVRDTILHEIAHALVGPTHDHDYVWRQKAREIGCNGDRCYNSKVVVTPDAKYHAVCSTCGHTHKRHKALRSTRLKGCGFCYKKGITTVLYYKQMY